MSRERHKTELGNKETKCELYLVFQRCEIRRQLLQPRCGESLPDGQQGSICCQDTTLPAHIQASRQHVHTLSLWGPGFSYIQVSERNVDYLKKVPSLHQNFPLCLTNLFRFKDENSNANLGLF